ncbi:excinuclease ABC, C subunit [Mageeibacillus indolicus UPII9-5]|uniref:UvrABC system protein C n=1 Tax=Mageeibacillus indolicus (strain UPII9-5) TaxID=699246 RepID=D3R295_MAGIU|nr:excinuclease ABC subunit UvrC [Mageeibacillus indolicus]ADC91474.1 excinuclease ABC, C subunit [Mageeibacillus indolicus UPII9-5]
MPSFDPRLDLVPECPGVYLMKDATGQIIYIGKAINLRRRLRSYFGANPQGTLKVLTMISHIRDFDFIICANELEALLLESNLIKKYQPFYNVLLKDNHDYPYLCISWQEPYPRIYKAYRIGNDIKRGAKYYGPYLNGDLNRALAAIHALFPLKTCNRTFPRDIGKERPCLNYHIKRCIGPCLGSVSATQYRAVVRQVADYLEGKYPKLLAEIEKSMKEAADNLDFERAAVLRDRLSGLKALIARAQRVTVSGQKSMDVYATAREGGEICIQKLQVRFGKITGTGTFFLQDPQPVGMGEDRGQTLLFDFILQDYLNNTGETEMIVLPPYINVDSVEWDNFKRWLFSAAGREIQLCLPKKGHKYELWQMAEMTAEKVINHHAAVENKRKIQTETAWQYLAELCGLKGQLKRIEAYDVSNNGSQDIVCAMTVFENGLANKKAYRDFNLSYQTEIDDYAAMAETLRRRIKHFDDSNFGAEPQLILVDGGLGHVHTVQGVLAEVKSKIKVAGMVKDDRHRTRGLVLPEGQVLELAKSVKTTHAGVLPSVSGDYHEADKEYRQAVLLKLLTEIQDETHRRAIRANRNRSRDRQLRYKLEAVPGIGPKRRALLLDKFGSLKDIAAAPVSELVAKTGLPTDVAHKIFAFFHQDGCLPD